MSQAETFKTHVLHKQLTTLSETLSKNEFELKDDNDRIMFQKIVSGQELIKSHIERIVPVYAPIAVMNNMQQSIAQCNNEIQAFIKNKNKGHLQNATNHIESSISNISGLVPFEIFSDQEFSSATVLGIESSLQKAQENIRKSLSDIETKIEATKKKIAEGDSKLEAHNTEIKKQIEETVKKFGTMQTQYEANENKRVSDTASHLKNFLTEKNEILKKYETEKDSVFSEYSKEYKELLVSLESNGVETLKFLEERKNNAQTLVNIIGNIGITGNYKKIADEEKKGAETLRNYSMIFMIGMILVFVVTLFSAIYDFKWQIALFRFSVGLIFLVPAAYTATESSKHRRREREARKYELELASLGPYLEKVPEKNRAEIVAKLAENYFGTGITEKEMKDGVSRSELFEFFKTIVDKVVSSR